MVKNSKKYILFEAGKKTWAWPLSEGNKFFACEKITALPQVDPKIKGLIYYEGNMVTILDTVKILGLKPGQRYSEVYLLFFYEEDAYALMVEKGDETIFVARTYNDNKKKQFKKYLKNKQEKIYILDPKELVESLDIYD